MNPKKVNMLLLIGFIISAATCFLLCYLLIDKSISYKYLDDSNSSTILALDKVVSLLQSDWKGMSTQEVLKKMESERNRKGKESIVIDVNSEFGVIWFDEIGFEFESGKLKRIKI
ncbi:Imm58 family immunity protein [Desulfuromonas acetoxidans]|uniref:Imm58 family immunity protein n=1 Tax=Desulfuromonas acetoxidans TaxID=891 RepID=UPI00292D7561|nr:Imm58 family immunity protein [Desulfuromonas acetoxidans]